MTQSVRTRNIRSQMKQFLNHYQVKKQNLFSNKFYRKWAISSLFTLTGMTPLLIPTPAHAQFIGQISYAGTGCPQDSLHQSVGNNGRSLILTPDNFSVEAASETGRILDRRSCSISIPIAAPEKMQVALSTIISGSGSVSQDGSLTITQTLFNSGEGPESDLRLESGLTPGHRNFRISSRLEAGLKWSPCGQSTLLRTNLALIAKTSGYGAVDKMTVRLHFRTCPSSNE